MINICPKQLASNICWHRHPIIILMSVLLFACASPQQYSPFTNILNNVSYSSVLALPTVPPSHIIQYGENNNQVIWYYKAQEDVTFAGVVILVHGGCWLSDYDIGHTQAMSKALAHKGYAVWNIEYRRTNNGGEWPVALNDIRLGVKTLYEQNPYQLDLSNIKILGHSAGGHLAMLLGGELSQNDKYKNSRIQILGLAPIVDIEAYAQGQNSCQLATPDFMQGGVNERAQEYRAASVLSYTFNPQHAFVLTGGQDNIVPKAFAVHPDTTQLSVLEAGHFDWIHPDTAAFKLLINILNRPHK